SLILANAEGPDALRQQLVSNWQGGDGGTPDTSFAYHKLPVEMGALQKFGFNTYQGVQGWVNQLLPHRSATTNQLVTNLLGMLVLPGLASRQSQVLQTLQGLKLNPRTSETVA